MPTPKELKRQLLEDAPRFTLDDRFKFSCHPGVTCFNRCCADINIFLTPYDVLRLKTRLGITSNEFLKEFAVVPFSEEIKQPVPLIKMTDEPGKPCPFVGPKGCTVYEDRPWACRMYPLGMASPRDESDGERFYFLLEEDHCKGFGEDKEFTVREWIENQGITEYDEAGELFKPISLHPFWDGNDRSPSKVDMYFMAAYDVDKFRRFVFGSSFLQKFDVEPEVVAVVETDDFELMKLGFRWIRFALGYEPTLELNAEQAAAGNTEKAWFGRGNAEPPADD